MAKWELTKEQMQEINNSMPPEAKYGDVFVFIARAARLQLMTVQSSRCKHGKLVHLCPICWADLRAKVEGK